MISVPPVTSVILKLTKYILGAIFYIDNILQLICDKTDLLRIKV